MNVLRDGPDTLQVPVTEEYASPGSKRIIVNFGLIINVYFTKNMKEMVFSNLVTMIKFKRGGIL